MKTHKELRTTLATAERIWLSRQEINDSLIPECLSAEDRLQRQVDLAHNDYELARAFSIAETLKWVLKMEDADDENMVQEMLRQYQPPERTGERV